MIITLIILVSLLSCTAQLCQKKAAHLGLKQGKLRLFLWLGLSLILLGIAMLLWLLVLRVVPVSVAYPMLSLNFVFIALAARAIWHEQLSARQLAGTVIIVIGVGLMGSHL